MLICERICDNPLVKLYVNYSYDIVELVNEMKQYRENTLVKLVAYYHEIIRYLIFVFEGFEAIIQTVCSVRSGNTVIIRLDF